MLSHLAYIATTHFASPFVSTSLRGDNLSTSYWDSLGETALGLAKQICSQNPNIHKFLDTQTSQLSLNYTIAIYPDLAKTYGRGSLVSGLFNAGNNSAKVELMDPRGYNPPYGRGVQVTIQPAELVLYSATQPVLIPPQLADLVAVEVGYFTVSPAILSRVLDFERDPCVA